MPACLQLEGAQAKYQKLLAKHNRLVNKCLEAKVDWHQHLEAPAAPKLKKGKKRTAAAPAAAAAPAPAAAAPVAI